MKFATLVNSIIGLSLLLGITACSQEDEAAKPIPATSAASADVFVQLFEWRWNDVATECETVLGPAGYKAVQTSPAHEHVAGPQWWTRYQPVSYKIESRGGTRAEFASMVRRCKDAGVDIYADALTNHMSSVGSGTGVAGSGYSEYSYTVPYDFDDFHHCGRNGDDSIANYQDQWEVQNCMLGTLADLDTSKPDVRAKIAGYLNDLLSLGVAGFRMDAVKHIAVKELEEILRLVDASPVILQEVPDRGNEPIKASDYLINGSVIEVKYPAAMTAAFLNGDLESLQDLGKRAGFLPADQSVVFVDNHDLQRGHGGSERILRYKDGSRYDLAVSFMLAYPYGYPMVMSSYYFDDSDQGPDNLAAINEDNSCNEAWVCEHRRQAVTGMVKFRRATASTNVTNWQVTDNDVLSFGRGDNGHVVFNVNDEAVSATVASSMPVGLYCDAISGGPNEDGCSGKYVRVDDDGYITATLEPLSAIAIHVDGSEAPRPDVPDTHTVNIVVRVPDDTPPLYLTGNLDALGPWNPKQLLMNGEGRERNAMVVVDDEFSFEYKFTLGNWERDVLDSTGVEIPNFKLDVHRNATITHEIVAFSPSAASYMADWKNSGVLGTLVYWPDVKSEFLSEARHVEVWLPPDYDEDPERQFKVIYMHDGQSLFDPRVTEYGVDWGVDEAMGRGVDDGQYESAIVVGTWNTPRRLQEYSPWEEAPQFARFIIEEIMPRVNAKFRTLKGPQNTFTMGSSMGGLLSFYLVKEHPDVFGACGCLSSHFSLSDAFLTMAAGGDPTAADATPYIVSAIAEGFPAPSGGRFLFDYGTEGLDAEYAEPHAVVREWLLQHDLVEGEDFVMREYAGADHNNASWRARLNDQLVWLLGR